MVGNDIVDLAEAKQASNWQRPRFLDKLFTCKEQQLIYNSGNPFLMVWRLWSMKEAAYKLYVQLHPSRFYNPKSFDCNIQFENGIVRYKDFECQVRTKITSKYILSDARLVGSKISSKVVELKDCNPKIQSDATKDALLSELSKLYQVSKAELKFQKSDFGIPTVSFNSGKIQVSLSHHGFYGAYAIS